MMIVDDDRGGALSRDLAVRRVAVVAMIAFSDVYLQADPAAAQQLGAANQPAYSPQSG